jgi:O-antigen ligase
MNWRGGIRVALLLALVALCLFEFVLHWRSSIFCEFEAPLLQAQWMLLICLVIWCSNFLFLTFSVIDLPLIGLLLIAMVAYLIGDAAVWRETDAIILLAGATLGKGVRFALIGDRRWKMEDWKNNLKIVNRKSAIVNFLVGLVVLLTFSSWWHLDVPNYFYQGLRWTGLWNNPNIYGMLMGAGLVLAAGLLIGEHSRCSPHPASNLENANDEASLAARGALSLSPIFLWIGAGTTAVGLFFSYSRGAWLGTAIGLLYLAKAHCKFKWSWVLPGILVAATAVYLFWHSTADDDAWYLKRLDLGRPSAQHRVAAWKAAVHIMRDHPLGVGWNQAVNVYEENYSPPENGAAAITMNSYLMLGTELGLPGLLCFVGYVALCLGTGRWNIANRPRLTLSHPHLLYNPIREGGIIACRAGALALLVAFWFDGGLFTLATASVFWILLELGTAHAATLTSC